MASELPVATGGTVVDGTYFLTANKVYSGPGGTSGPTGGSVRSTFSIQSGTIRSVSWHDGLTEDVRWTGTWVTSGNQGTITTLCGPAQAQDGTSSFTASGSELRIITALPPPPDPNGIRDRGGEGIFTRQ